MSCRMGCESPAVSNGFCEMCRKRVARGGDLGAPKQERVSPRQRVREAAMAAADADSEDDDAYEKADANLFAAVSRYRDPMVLRELAARNAPLGGAARAAALTAERRQEIARIAAVARSQKLSKEQRGRLAKYAAQARWKHRNACLPGQASIRKPPRMPARQPPVKR